MLQKNTIFINGEVNWYHKLKESIRKKIRIQLSDSERISRMDVKKVSMNLLKIYLITQCLD